MSAMKLMKDAAAAAAILAVCVALYWPRPTVRPAPSRDMGAPSLYVPAVVPPVEPAPSCPAETTPAPAAESKSCKPACVYPEKCVEGTCCRPAATSRQHSDLLFVHNRIGY